MDIAVKVCDALALSSLSKVFADERPISKGMQKTVLIGDVLSFQVACMYKLEENCNAIIRVNSPLADWITIRAVKLAPSMLPAPAKRDNRYLRTTPGMYPDRLVPLDHGRMKLISMQWRSLWIDLEPDGRTPTGKFPIMITGETEAGEGLFCVETEVEVFPVRLPPGDIVHTEWLHTDCLANYYQVPVFSDAHFEIIQRFLETAIKRGVNTVLTPLFTPPLDTAVGGERTTVQLVEVEIKGGRYQFEFALFRKFVQMCKSCGIILFELSHLFSQWGAKYAPKIMAKTDKGTVKLFGWHTEAQSEEYRAFLAAFLPKLEAELRYLGIEKNCVLHISDEPTEEQMSSYQAAKSIVREHMKGYPIVDAVSDIQFYEKGIITHPVAAIDQIEPFLDAKVPNLWTYYCCAQTVDVTNRFFSMPAYRNRILGVQLYRHQINGFLHWGYNFYNSQYSEEAIDPYAVTDVLEAFPSGDAFLVYPGKNGVPEESMRLMVLNEAFNDIRALKLLERKKGREYVLELLKSKGGMDVGFKQYPNSDGYLIDLRDAVNREIAEDCIQ